MKIHDLIRALAPAHKKLRAILDFAVSCVTFNNAFVNAGTWLDLSSFVAHTIDDQVYLPAGTKNGQICVLVATDPQIYVDTDEECNIYFGGSATYILGFNTAGSVTLIWRERPGSSGAWYVIATTGTVVAGLPGN